MSKPKEFWIVYGSQGSCMLCHKEPEIKIQFGNEYIHVREVTPADEAKDEALKDAEQLMYEARQFIYQLGQVMPSYEKPAKWCSDLQDWIAKYGEPEGISND